MTIRLILRLRRQLAEAQQENTRREREIQGLNAEIADVRADNTELRAEAAESREWQLTALEVIKQLTSARDETFAKLKEANRWAAAVERTTTCINQENDRLKAELAGLKRPIAQVIPLQKRGPEAA